MFSPSDYNDAVPQFTNGNYANTPLNPLYIEEPDAVNYNRGAEPLQTLPAQWWNWLCNKITAKLNKLNIYVKNIFDELTQLLSLVGITPDATELEVTVGQLKEMFKTNYPQYLENNFTSDVGLRNNKSFFSAGGMFEYTAESQSSTSWLGKVFKEFLITKWIDVKYSANTPVFYSVYFNNNLWIACCPVGYVDTAPAYWSNNGKTWTAVTTTGGSVSFVNVCYANNIWVATTDNGLYWSENGKEWTRSNITAATFCVCYSNGLWVAGGGSYIVPGMIRNGLYWSEDGKEWTLCTGTNNSGYSYITYKNGLWEACTWSLNMKGILWSTDGKNWTSGTTTELYLGDFSCVIYEKGIWVAGSGTPTNLYDSDTNIGIFWSNDGKAWVQCSSFNALQISSIAFGNGIFVACAQDLLLWSEDGKNWSQSTTSIPITSDWFCSVCYANGYFVAVRGHKEFGGTTGDVWMSKNGKDWTKIYDCGDNGKGSPRSTYYANGRWFVTTDNAILGSFIEDNIKDSNYFVN